MAKASYSTGDLDHRITFLTKDVTGLDLYEEEIVEFVQGATVWAKRIDVSAGEAFKAKEVGAEITVHFVVRYSPETVAINAKDRIRLEDGLTYDITGKRELQRNRWLEFHAVARAEEGPAV